LEDNNEEREWLGYAKKTCPFMRREIYVVGLLM
jgi:hypothetical protein